MEFDGPDPRRMEVIAVTDKIHRPAMPAASAVPSGKGSFSIGSTAPKPGADGLTQGEFHFEVGEMERAIYSKVVEKCGNRHHWEDWASDIAKIARTHITRITGILDNPENTREREAFAGFSEELRDDLNDSITDAEIIEMLAQHLITKPVFDALFDDYSFASHNPISQAMQATL
ncbi:hypothetical protein [Rhodospirillum sp. A1_3_36]|uniref:hypothetical protein n=1 Tax=Rhodospirillum sp. A1_3_36 TaxID=3391666 RepID=UPI0039A64AF4